MGIVNNIVGFMKKSSLSKVGKSDTYNMVYCTKDPTEHGFTAILRPMPGYDEVLKVAGAPQGTFRCSRGNDGVVEGKPVVYGVWGRKLYIVARKDAENPGVFEPFFVGDIAGSGKVMFCETSGYGKNHPHLVIVDGKNVYCVDTMLPPVRQREYFRTVELPFRYPDSRTSRIMPSWCAFMYGYLLVGDEGTDIFYRSYQYPFEKRDERDEIDYDIFEVRETGKDADGKYTGFGYGHWTMAEWQPDNSIVGCSNGSRLFVLGERSFQVFAYQNSVDMPFSSPDTASMPIGIKSRDSAAMYSTNIYWLGSADMGDGVVYTMGPDASPNRISTDEVEEVIAGLDASTVNAFCMRVAGHPMYVLNFGADGVTLCYDIKEGGWVRLGSRKKAGTEGCYRYCNAVTSPDGRLWLQFDGGLAEATESHWTEHDGTPILRKRVGGIITSEMKPFKVNKLSVLTNNGDYPLMKGRNATVTIKYSTDGVTFTSVDTKSLGKVGQYDYDVVLRRLGGKSKFFGVEIGTSDNIPFALYAIDIQAVRLAD